MIDLSSLAEGISRPGMDPRQWISNALVERVDPVLFDDELGPLVSVTLEPGGEQVQARVGSGIAGDGEAEYFPFVEGDEVLVALPQGNPRGGAVIIARLHNKRAPFPSGSVAGQDPTKNAFAFKRTRTPFISEHEGPVMIRSSISEALISIDTKGTITMRDGQKSALQLSPDLFGFQSGDAKYLLQLDLTGGRFTLQVDDALLTLSSSKASPEASAIAVPGSLSISTSSNPAAEHAISTEAVLNILAAWTQALGVAITAALPGVIVTPGAGAPLGPLIGTPLGLVFSSPAGLGLLAAAATTAASGTLDPGIAAAIAAAFTSAQQKPPGAPGVGQTKPGIGCAGMFLG